MPTGEEDVNLPLDSSASETMESQQELPQGESPEVADASPQSDIDTPPATPAANDTKPVVPDPVQDAIAKLAKPEPGAKPAAKAETSEPPPAKPEEKVESATKKAEPTLEDPFAGWLTEQQQNLLKPQTRQRINDLHHKWKEAETHPDRVLGNEFNTLLESNGLREDIGFVPPDHLAGLVKAQAAVNRSLLSIEQGRRPAGSDLQAFQALAQQVDSLRGQFGLVADATESAIAPVTGKLSQEHQDLVDIYGLSEARVRLLAAIEAKGTPKTEAKAPVQAYQPPPKEIPEGVDMERVHAQRIAGVLAKDGVPSERMRAYQKSLEPAMQKIVALEFPGIQPEQIPAVFNELSTKERSDIFLRAHAESRAAKVAPPIQPKTLAPPTRPALTGQAPRARVPDSTLDPVQSAIAMLSRRNDGE